MNNPTTVLLCLQMKICIAMKAYLTQWSIIVTHSINILKITPRMLKLLLLLLDTVTTWKQERLWLHLFRNTFLFTGTYGKINLWIKHYLILSQS